MASLRCIFGIHYRERYEDTKTIGKYWIFTETGVQCKRCRWSKVHMFRR